MTDEAPGEADARRHALIEVGEELAPMYEFAAGQRVLLEAQGWSPAVAEQIAAVLLTHMLHNALTPPNPAQVLANILGGGQ